MKLVGIFVHEESKSGLHSIILNKGKSEYDKLFDNWFDIGYIRKYCQDNLEHLQSGFYGDISLEEAITEIRKEIEEINKRLLESFNENSADNDYDTIFKQLENKDYKIRELKPSKIKLDSRDHKDFKKSKVRVYAIRVSKNTFIITGGAIKVTEFMDGHVDTIAEEKKITLVRHWLKETEKITTDYNLIYYYNEH
ncbi:MAG: hypothetical protein Q8L27_00560 [archaeon]|nr:hypothetical protein [archaeon]